MHGNMCFGLFTGLSDPFVDITFGQHQKKTKVKRKTLNPKWENEQHEFPIVNWDMSNLLTLRVRDWDRVPTIGSSRELGYVDFSASLSLLVISLKRFTNLNWPSVITTYFVKPHT